MERLNRELEVILQMPEVQETLQSQGTVVTGGSPARFMEYLKLEYSKYAKLIKAAAIKNQ